MAAFAALLVLAGFTVIVLQYVERLMGADYRRGQRWFWKWYIKGVVGPMVIWVLYILGALPGVPSGTGGLFGPSLGSPRAWSIVVSPVTQDLSSSRLPPPSASAGSAAACRSRPP